VTGGTYSPYPPRGACANYMCRMYGCQGHCGGWSLSHPVQIQPRGCICPAGSEKTCQGYGCPRKPITASGIAAPSGVETGNTDSTEGKSPAPSGETPK
jgi:hypothetical protein